MIRSCLLCLLCCNYLAAAELRVAVASNFEPTLRALAAVYETTSDNEIVISSGSTGLLYAQIKQGAPFDVLMAADVLRPQKLVAEGLGSDLSIYAIGQLVLVANHSDCAAILSHKTLEHVAIAHPDLAPYGLAAKQYLQFHQSWASLQHKLVVGNNSAQALQMVITGNATAGIVARSLLQGHELGHQQCQLLIPQSEHEPIKQAMVFINSSEKRQIFNRFKAFLTSAQAQQIMLENGYSVAAVQ